MNSPRTDGADTSSSPRIIPLAEHPIRVVSIDREALKVLYRLRDAGHTAYLVGGGVRDLYLGKKPKDFDISTDAHPGELRKIFRNSRIIGRRFRLVQVFFHGNKIIEVATFRKRCEEEAGGDSNGTLLANNTFGTPVEDAFRRDLTINSLFFNVDSGSIIDYTGGVLDLDQGIIRLIGEPEQRIMRDPARIMRVIRHAARNNFAIDPPTWEACRTLHHTLSLCPVSRLRDELFKDLTGGAAARWAVLAVESGIFAQLLPFYRETLADKATLPALQAILGVCDRLHGEDAALDEAVLLAALLYPWAERTHNLTELSTERNTAYRFARFLRDQFDALLAPINIPRAVRETAAVFLANLSLFAGRDPGPPWLKTLKKKSYFPGCRLFAAILAEAQGGTNVRTQAITSVPPPVKKTAPLGKRPQKGTTRPAFATGAKKSIFGLKPERRRRR